MMRILSGKAQILYNSRGPRRLFVISKEFSKLCPKFKEKFSIWAQDRLSDAYRFCESRKMTLFQPDTKAKNLFLSKLAILVDKPILFDLYRFGTNFEFKYGPVFSHSKHILPNFICKFDKTWKASTHLSRIGSQMSQKMSAVYKWQVENHDTSQKTLIGKWNRRYKPDGKR